MEPMGQWRGQKMQITKKATQGKPFEILKLNKRRKLGS